VDASDEARIESLRRSHACTGGLPPDGVAELVNLAWQMKEERQRIRVLLAALPADFGKVRDTLNELSKVVR
jgi:hypothetical protein